jgi:hypothetical protein
VGVHGGAERGCAGAAAAEHRLETAAIEQAPELGAGEDQAEGVGAEEVRGREEGLRQRGDGEVIVEAAGEIPPAGDLDTRT